MNLTHLTSTLRPLGQHAPKAPGKSTPLQAVTPHVSRDHGQAPPLHLTPRQLEVLALLCEGLPNKLISRRLNIAAGTVKVHVSVILRELQVASRLQAVVAAQRWGLLDEAAVDTSEPEAAPEVTVCAGAVAAHRASGAVYALAAAL